MKSQTGDDISKSEKEIEPQSDSQSAVQPDDVENQVQSLEMTVQHQQEEAQQGSAYLEETVVPTGWLKDDQGNTTYVNEDGTTALGYQTIDGELYYFNHKGIQAKGLRVHPSGTIRYYDIENGKAVKNTFITDEKGNTYYFDRHGKAVRGEQIINGASYYFNDKGILEQSLFPTVTDEADQGKHLLSMIIILEEQLNQKGLSLQQFAQLPEKSPEFYQKLNLLVSDLGKQLSPRTINEKELAEKAYQEASKISDKWVYAVEMANLNMRRDRNAQDINKEIVYMYLSHFVDIKSGVLDTVDPSISDDGYFSAWIVNEDRRAYDQYLSRLMTVEKAATAAKLVKSVMEFGAGTLELSKMTTYLLLLGKHFILDYKQKKATITLMTWEVLLKVLLQLG